MSAPVQKPALLAAGVVGDWIVVDYIWFVTAQSALQSNARTIANLEREVRSLTTGDA